MRELFSIIVGCVFSLLFTLILYKLHLPEFMIGWLSCMMYYGVFFLMKKLIEK